MSILFEKETQCFIAGKAGKIEAIINGLPGVDKIDEIAVICHPHPLHEGTMHNKVVHTLMRTFRDKQVAVVRFNYRGVQHSEGQYGDGVGECEDLLSVVSYMLTLAPYAEISLCGFSFGGYIAAQGADDLYQQGIMLKRLFLIAPSVVHFDFSHLSLSFVEKVVVQAKDDDIVPHEGVMQMYKGLAAPKALIEFEQAGHFFHGQLGPLKAALSDYIL